MFSAYSDWIDQTIQQYENGTYRAPLSDLTTIKHGFYQTYIGQQGASLVDILTTGAPLSKAFTSQFKGFGNISEFFENRLLKDKYEFLGIQFHDKYQIKLHFRRASDGMKSIWV